MERRRARPGWNFHHLVGPALLVWACCGSALAQRSGVASTVHNLSVSGPGEVRALSETEICKFCHIPHTDGAPVPMWSHEMSKAQYATPQMRDAKGSLQIAPQPDGSSRLCLSCHDGTVALGEIARSGDAVVMAGAQRLNPGRRGYIGTDLSGSHPVSIVVPDGEAEILDSGRDMGIRPIEVIRADGQVKLDKMGKMQCTSCHDPHSDQYYVEGRVPRFWIKPTVEEVCLTCHVPS